MCMLGLISCKQREDNRKACLEIKDINFGQEIKSLINT
jgi:hypothetical protein